MGQRNKDVVITNATNGTIICSMGRLANTFVLRLFGLLGKSRIDPQAGLLIRPSSGVHTFGMRFPIDIVSLDKANRVLGTWENIGPGNVRGVSLRTRSVLELAGGRIRECGIATGDQIVVEPAT